MKYLRATQNIGLAIILLFGLVDVAASWGTRVQAQNTVVSLQSLRVLVEVGQGQTQAHLNAYGAKLLEDYGRYQLWQLPPQQRTAKLSIPNALTSATALDTIWLRGASYIDTSSPTDAAYRANDAVQNIPARLQQAMRTQPQLWLVQFIGPLKSSWLAALKDLGAKPVAYLPNNAYIVWADANAIGQINSLIASKRFIHWAGPYQPSYRLAPDLLAALSADGSTNAAATAQAVPTLTLTVTV